MSFLSKTAFSTGYAKMAPNTPSKTNSRRRYSFKGTASLPSIVLREICCVLDVDSSEIDINAGFLELGGHSFSAIDLASACKRHGINILVEDILLVNNVAELLGAATWIDQPSMDNLPPSPSHFALKRGAEPALGRSSKRQQCAASKAPMTEMQQVLIHGSQANPGTNIISFYETYQTKDVPILKRAWKTVIGSESIFRTAFNITEDSPTLTEETQPQFSWEEVVVRSEECYDKALEEAQQSSSVFTSFKVVTWPRDWQDSTLSTVVWRVHHALIDGFSAALVYAKVQQAAAGLPIRAGTPFIQVATNLEALYLENQAACQEFWGQQLGMKSNAVGDILLPAPPSTHTFGRNATKSITVSFPVDRILECARKTNVSAVSVHHAAWAMVLSKYNDSECVVFGVVLAGRNLPIVGVEDSIGPLVNTLPLHVSLERSWTASRYMRHVFKQTVELGSVQYSRPADGFKRTFASALATEFEMDARGFDVIRPVGKSDFTAVVDVPLSIFIGSDKSLRICYHCQSFNQKDIERLAKHYQNALLSLTATESSVEDCMASILSTETHGLLRQVGNCLTDSTRASSVDDDLVTLFDHAVSENPASIALEKGSQQVSYRELSVKVGRVAKKLSNIIMPGDVVCVNADRSTNWIVAIYGILKAGGIYSPQDPALPAAVRDVNFQSAGARAFLVSNPCDKGVKPNSCCLCLAINDLLTDPEMPASDVCVRHLSTPSANAYICFTSGSTGKPKGVICTHEGLVAFQRTLEVRLFAGPGRKISQIMAPAFDGSIHEIFSALSYGATLVLPDSSLDPISHLRLVDSAILTPSIAQKLAPSDFPRLKTVSALFKARLAKR